MTHQRQRAKNETVIPTSKKAQQLMATSGDEDVEGDVKEEDPESPEAGAEVWTTSSTL